MSATPLSTRPDEAEPGADGRLIPASTPQMKRIALLRGPDHWWKHPLVWAFAYPGRLDVPRLEQALRLVVRRHSGLRMYLLREESDQVGCLPPEEARWPLIEITSGSDPAAAEAEAHAYLQKHFDPYERPLLRAVVLHRPDGDVLGLAAEHTIIDHAAGGELFDDLRHVYDGLLDRPASAFDELVTDAARFAREERAWFSGDEAKQALAWWDQHTEGLGAYPGLELPELGRPEPYVPIIDYDFVIPPEDAVRLKKYAAGLRITPTMLASAAMAVTLRAYGHPADARFLFATSRRQWPSAEKVVGYTSNRMMVRLPVAADDTVSSLAGKARTEVMGAVRHSMFSHEEYVRLRHPDAFGRFPTIYGYLNSLAYSPTPQLGGQALTRQSLPKLQREYHQPGLAMGLFLYQNGRAVANASCAEGMYEREFVERFTRDFARACVGTS